MFTRRYDRMVHELEQHLGYQREIPTLARLENGKYHCLQCGRVETKVRMLLKHYQHMHGRVPWQKRSESIRERTIICDTCGTNVKYRRRFDHVHFQVTRYCNECSQDFSSKQRLKIHLVTNHFPALGVPCSVCERLFGSEKHLLSHMRSHANPKGNGPLPMERFKCNECGRMVTNLKSHMRVHMGESARIYACKLCPNRFKSSGNLSSHMAVHTRERKYACRYCPWSFTFFSTQRNHERKIHGK